MPAFGTVRRRDLVTGLKRLGFAGPFSGGRHEFMTRGAVSVTIPNPHRGDISSGLLAVILRQAGVTRRDWKRA